MSPRTSLSDTTIFRLSARTQLGLLAFAAMAGGAWYSLKADTAVNSAEINNVKQDNIGIRQEQREMREILIRVDENVKLIQREQRRVRLDP